ncbi:MAG TPA: hypothetical protein VFP61_06180, partial [Acidimicrobiales bacterium]|nr:hypothetical protein [Acidimicrobiales bacterium]
MGSTQRRQPAPQGGRRRAAASWGAVAALAGASAVALAAVGAGGAATAVRAGSAATTSATSPAAAAGPSAAPAALAPSGPRTIAPAGRPAAGSSPTTAAAAVAPRAGSPAPSPAAVAVAAPAAGTTVPATAPPATATTAAYHRTTAPAVGRSGTALTLDGVRHQFVGVDAYQLGTDWGVNTGCGGMASDSQLSAFFASLPPASLVRIWGFQGSIGTTAATHQIDWAPLDRVFSAAAAHGDYIVLSLGDQAGTCDDSSWHGLDWYQGGYRDVVDPTGATPLSYWTYVQDAVAHFESSPALAMWEPMNEAEASTCAAGLTGSACFQGLTCPSESAAASALRSFFDAVGGEIHALDPRHL